jgi:hypothetical protein
MAIQAEAKKAEKEVNKEEKEIRKRIDEAREDLDNIGKILKVYYTQTPRQIITARKFVKQIAETIISNLRKTEGALKEVNNKFVKVFEHELHIHRPHLQFAEDITKRTEEYIRYWEFIHRKKRLKTFLKSALWKEFDHTPVNERINAIEVILKNFEGNLKKTERAAVNKFFEEQKGLGVQRIKETEDLSVKLANIIERKIPEIINKQSDEQYKHPNRITMLSGPISAVTNARSLCNDIRRDVRKNPELNKDLDELVKRLDEYRDELRISSPIKLPSKEEAYKRYITLVKPAYGKLMVDILKLRKAIELAEKV